MGETIAASGPTQTRLTGRAGTRRTWGLVPLSTCEETRRRDSSAPDRGNEAEETDQVYVNQHESRGQQGNQADECVRPSMLEAGAWQINTRTRAPLSTASNVIS